MKWPTDADQHAYMKMRQNQNKQICTTNRNENWMFEILKRTGLKWSRQAQWGYRLFDFWNAAKGIAVEVDGPEHDPEYDCIRDAFNYKKSGIVVLRVRNGNDEDAAKTVVAIHSSGTWNERRVSLGLKPIKE